MIRSIEWKYVHRYPYGPHELYDMINDPHEEVNLIGDSGKKEIIEELKSKLDNWFVKYVDIAKDGAREPVTGAGQIGPAGLAANGKQAFAVRQSK